MEDRQDFQESTFTFYCSSIKGYGHERVRLKNCNLHSTVVLLKVSSYSYPTAALNNLHSTVVLLKDTIPTPLY